MTTFWNILAWELRTGVRRISTWVYFVVYLALAFFFMLAAGGAWNEISVALGSGGKVLANSPFALATLIPVMWLVGMSITAALAGQALYRDYEARIDPLIYTTPINKGAFLAGRFTGAVAINLIVLSSIAIGAFLATHSPWVKADKIAPFVLSAYLDPYVMFVIPNVILTAAIFFALVSLTREMVPVYVGGVILLIGYLASGTLIRDIDNKQLAALIDPFGRQAHTVMTQYWSISEKNSKLVPFAGPIAMNRALWLAIAFVIFGIAYRRFRFAHTAGDVAGRVAAGAAEVKPRELVARVQPSELPRAHPRFDGRARLYQFWAEASRASWRIVSNRYFATILVAALFLYGVTVRQAGRLFGTGTWPVTYQIEEAVSGLIGVFVYVLIAIYAGELVWADRDTKTHQIVDATPVPTYVMMLARLAAMCLTLIGVLVVMMLAGIITQALRGYFHFELPLYLQALFGIRFIDLVLFAIFALAVHVVSNHKYVGHFVVILLYIALSLFPLLGLQRNLYTYSADAGIVYSDMNQWGPYLRPWLWWKLYWMLFAMLLLIACNLLWMRGEETALVQRLRLARQRFRGRIRTIGTATALSFAGLGAFLYYNTDRINVYRTSKEDRLLNAEREKKYKRYEQAPQPRITAVNVRVDLRPRAQAVVATGTYVLRNKTRYPIDTIHVGLNEAMSVRTLTFDGGGTRLIADSTRDYHMYRLARPLAPGDSTVMRFALEHETRGIPNRVRNTFLVENGSFLSSGLFLPSIGYDARSELSDDDDRKKEGLKAKPRMRPPTDTATWSNNYVSHDADFVDFRATVSTDPDQIAIAPGYLTREWTENGRRVFEYVMDAPILDLWAVLSARYAVKKDKWRDVDIAVYYHPSHAYNLDRMIASVKKSLDYYTTVFGPYQHRQVRILEFPRYASFAQSLPNTIPYSEAIGFIARVEKPEDVDYPFYVTAHEMAHQWWAHQLIGADAQGSTMLSETLSQYSALMVMEREYGASNMRKFLAYELDNYLLQRSTERKKEMPLELVENQPYIHYNKGSLVMYALRDYIGAERVNAVLKSFLAAHRFKGPPYPTSLDLVKEFRAVTPDSLKYLITDLFETITMYELRTDSVVTTDAPGEPGKFQVDLFANAKKLRADSLGKETEIPINDWIDIGVFVKAPSGSAAAKDPDGVPIYLGKHLVKSGAQKFTVVVSQRPYRAGIDPLHKLIDRMTRDNTVGVRDRAARPKVQPAARRTKKQ